MFDWLRKRALTPDQRNDWDENGYLILRAFIDPSTIERLNQEIKLITSGQPLYPDATVDVLEGAHCGKRFKLSAAPKDAFTGAIKLNDLFLESEAVRACNINRRIALVLRELLDGDPLVCNSLNFLYGSRQGAHYDSWFMPPLVDNKMLATSICLDEVNEDNGPVFMYPGSHKIPPFRFPHGGIGRLDADLQPAIDYATETTKSIKPVKFLGKPGDVLIWNGQLLHGGSEINDRNMTRRSLVTHYFRAVDTDPKHKTKIAPSAYIMKRPHAHVH